MTGWNVIFPGPYAGTAQEEAARADDTVAGQGALPGAEIIRLFCRTMLFSLYWKKLRTVYTLQIEKGGNYGS
jgi:hypothetical protein